MDKVQDLLRRADRMLNGKTQDPVRYPENERELFAWHGVEPPAAPAKRQDSPEVKKERGRYYAGLEKSLIRLHKLEEPESNPHAEQSRQELVSTIKQFISGKRGA